MGRLGSTSRGTGDPTDGDLAQGAASPLVQPPSSVRTDRGGSGGAATANLLVAYLDSK